MNKCKWQTGKVSINLTINLTIKTNISWCREINVNWLFIEEAKVIKLIMAFNLYFFFLNIKRVKVKMFPVEK